MPLTEQPCTLPSKGRPYGDRIPNGVVQIKQLSAGDLSMLFSQGNEADRVERIIRAVTTIPGGVKHSDLLLSDRMGILLAVRIISFGAKYGFEYTCKSCGADCKHTCDLLQDLHEREFEGDCSPTFDIVLPDCGHTVTLRFVTGADERAIMTRTKQTVAKSVGDPGDPSALFRQATVISRIDGNDAGDIIARETFVRNLSARDSIIIDNEIEAREPGIDLTVRPECQRCGAENELVLPFTLEFFRPRTLRA